MIINKPLVSVICLAYNHEKYIRQALDTILSQKTDFAFEILVNDDCSTDNTKEILKEYDELNGSIRVLFQEKNLYSQGVSPISVLIKEAKGDILAFCECDDYFCDDNKLQIQVDSLKKVENCVACVHKSIKVSNEGKELGVRQPLIRKQILSIEDLVLCVGQLYALNSLVCYKFAVEDILDNPMYKKCTVQDIPIALHLGLKGQILYLDKSMSAYRVQSDGSWSQQMKNNPDKDIQYIESVIDTLKLLDEMTDYRYSEVIDKRIETNQFHLLIKKNDLPKVFGKHYRKYLKIIRKRDVFLMIWRYICRRN